jgi:hypothetical protein
MGNYIVYQLDKQSLSTTLFCASFCPVRSIRSELQVEVSASERIRSRLVRKCKFNPHLAYTYLRMMLRVIHDKKLKAVVVDTSVLITTRT